MCALKSNHWFRCIKTPSWKFSREFVICRDMGIKTFAHVIFSLFTFVRFINAYTWIFTTLLFIIFLNHEDRWEIHICKFQLMELPFSVDSFLSSEPFSLFYLCLKEAECKYLKIGNYHNTHFLSHWMKLQELLDN